jgi:hypothetical protein
MKDEGPGTTLEKFFDRMFRDAETPCSARVETATMSVSDVAAGATSGLPIQGLKATLHYGVYGGPCFTTQESRVLPVSAANIRG